jgi:AraC family transcriptional regulator of adaptative response/methylated-DNA-[protein]-cysteine methyltransferase
VFVWPSPSIVLITRHAWQLDTAGAPSNRTHRGNSIKQETDIEMKTSNRSDRDEKRWRAIVSRESESGDPFFYGVLTTGIYCRPGCSARTPNRENVVFFETSAEAEQQGYRSCRKCRPDRQRAFQDRETLIIEACRRLEKERSPVALKTLAEEAGLSPSYFHRLFKKIVGITPRQYYLKHRSDRFRRKLADGSSVAEAIYSAGFESLSGAYNRNDDRLAMTPKNYRKGAEGMQIVYGTAPCYLGCVLVAATARGVCAIELGDSEEQVYANLCSIFPKASIRRGAPQFHKLVKAVIQHLDNPFEKCQLPLDIQGTSFQQKVWEALRKIKPGTTTSYGELARQLGTPAAVRAVGGACAANKIAVLIPCHRVLTKDKKISGYRWGKLRKKLLLEKEKK